MYKVRGQELEAIKKHLILVDKCLGPTSHLEPKDKNEKARRVADMVTLLKNNDKLIKLLEDNFYI